VYSPGGAGVGAERSRLLCTLLKEGDGYFMDRYADRVRQQVADGPSLAGFFCASSILVPVPGSAPSAKGGTSVAEHLASALLSEGLGQCIWPGLRRIAAVAKSATAAPGRRPTVSHHYDSFAVEWVQANGLGDAASALVSPRPRLVLVDDVVTKGRTLLAAATRVREAFPNAEIRAFALVRTMGLVQGVQRLLDPCVGEIRWRAGDAHRNP